MRSFVVTAIILLIMIIMILLNSLYVTKITEKIELLVLAEDFGSDSVEELEVIWNKAHPILSLSSSYTEIDRMSELITELKFYSENGNRREKDRIRLLIKDTASDIRRTEEFDFENIF